MVTWIGSVAELPTSTCPKSKETGERTSVGGIAVPTILMKSSELLESEVISSALATVLVVCEEEAWGVNVTVMGQLVPGRMVPQARVTVKSGVVARREMWMAVVPVFVRETVCGAEAFPPEVTAKLREFCEAV